jgi:hypothetical protein
MIAHGLRAQRNLDGVERPVDAPIAHALHADQEPGSVRGGDALGEILGVEEQHAAVVGRLAEHGGADVGLVVGGGPAAGAAVGAPLHADHP